MSETNTDMTDRERLINEDVSNLAERQIQTVKSALLAVLNRFSRDIEANRFQDALTSLCSVATHEDGDTIMILDFREAGKRFDGDIAAVLRWLEERRKVTELFNEIPF